jgi:radical SAM superfamily enzyme YgiQ (UPF0313 family)
MRKPPNYKFEKFINLFENIKKKEKLKFYILPYIILSFPGSSNVSIKNLGLFLKKHKIKTFHIRILHLFQGPWQQQCFYARMDYNRKSLKIKESQYTIIKKGKS